MANRIPEATLDEVQDILGWTFEEPGLLATALQAGHGYYDSEPQRCLALVGDAVIRLLHYHDGIRRLQTAREISELQSIKGSNRNLAEKGFFLGLDRFLAEVRESNNAVPVGTKKMATTVEALIGAVYLDSYRHPTRRNTIDDAGSAAANLFLFDWPREEDY